MQMGFYFDQSRCIGCYTCIVACKDWHDVPAGPASWMRVQTIEEGKYPNVSVAFLAVSCYHCADPACVPACPVGAISRREDDGIVGVDKEACLGKDNCELCREACPYDAPQFGAEDNAKMQKCDLCLDRYQENQVPICVGACLQRALDAGPLKELKARYGDKQEAVGFIWAENVLPSIIFKNGRKTKT